MSGNFSWISRFTIDYVLSTPFSILKALILRVRLKLGLRFTQLWMSTLTTNSTAVIILSIKSAKYGTQDPQFS